MVSILSTSDPTRQARDETTYIIDIRMEKSGQKLHSWGFVGIIFSEDQGKLESTAFPRCVIGTTATNAPKDDPTTPDTNTTHDRWTLTSRLYRNCMYAQDAFEPTRK